MHAELTLAVDASGQAQRLADRVAGSDRLHALSGSPFAGHPQVIGRISFVSAGVPHADGQMVLFVIDNRTGTPARVMQAVDGEGGTDHLALGWDGRYERLATRYSWLKSLATPDEPGGYVDYRQTLSFRPTRSGPISFVALLDEDAPTVTDPDKDLTVVLAYVGDEQGAWADRLVINPPT